MLHLHHVLQRDFNGERHIGMTQDEGLVHVLVDPAPCALFFGEHNVVRYEASAAYCRALAVSIARINAAHAQAAIKCDFNVKSVIFGENHAEKMAATVVASVF